MKQVLFLFLTAYFLIPSCIADKAKELQAALTRKKEIESQVLKLKNAHERSQTHLDAIQERIMELKVHMTSTNDQNPNNKRVFETLSTDTLPIVKKIFEDRKDKLELKNEELKLINQKIETLESTSNILGAFGIELNKPLPDHLETYRPENVPVRNGIVHFKPALKLSETIPFIYRAHLTPVTKKVWRLDAIFQNPSHKREKLNVNSVVFAKLAWKAIRNKYGEGLVEESQYTAQSGSWKYSDTKGNTREISIDASNSKHSIHVNYVDHVLGKTLNDEWETYWHEYTASAEIINSDAL